MARLAIFLLAAICGTMGFSIGSVQLNGTTEGGKCICQISSNWSILTDHYQLEEARGQVRDLQASLNELSMKKIMDRMDSLTARISKLEQRVDNQSVSLNIAEIAIIKKDADTLLKMVDRLKVDGNVSLELNLLENQLEELATTMAGLASKNPYQQNKILVNEVKSNEDRLLQCEERIEWTGFPGDQESHNTSYDEDWCETHELESLGDAFTHKWVDKPSGSWFKDPVPKSEADKTKIYIRGSDRPTYVRSLTQYATYADFISGKPMGSRAHFASSGLGFTVFNNSLYWEAENRLNRLDFSTYQTARQRFSFSATKYSQTEISTYVDLKVDEYGLWAIAATSDNGNRLVLHNLDPRTMTVRSTYKTNRQKSATCAVFMVCGKLYALDLCNDRVDMTQESEQMTYMFDTRPAPGQPTDAFAPIQVSSKYGNIATINYNPREKILFAWDNRHLVTYKLRWRQKATEN